MERKGYMKTVEGFAVPRLIVERTTAGVYEVSVLLRTTPDRAWVFMTDETKVYKICIAKGVKTRPEAVRLAKEAREDLWKSLLVKIAQMQPPISGPRSEFAQCGNSATENYC